MWRKSADLFVAAVGVRTRAATSHRLLVLYRTESAAEGEELFLPCSASRTGSSEEANRSHVVPRAPRPDFRWGRWGGGGLAGALLPVAAVWNRSSEDETNPAEIEKNGGNKEDNKDSLKVVNSDNTSTCHENDGDSTNFIDSAVESPSEKIRESQIPERFRESSLTEKIREKLSFVLHAAEPINKNDGKFAGGDSISNNGGSGDGGKGLSRRARYNFIAEVVDETAPTLVYIEIKDTGVRDYFTGQPVTSSNGSGFIVREDGLILTNAHVVINKPRASIQVRLQSGEVYAGTVEDVDVRSDLATIRIACSGLPVLRLGSSADLRPGEWVVAMGSPLSLSNTITTGIVSNVARPPDELGLQGRDVPQYIQTDAAITFGNSGGPLINLDGEAIGINSMKVTPGISFAIPIDYAKEFLAKSEEAKKSGWPTAGGRRRYIGITMVSLSPRMLDELRTRSQVPASVHHGILVYRLVVGSPADRAGLQPGDVVTAINGQPIHGSRDVYKLLEGNVSPLNLTVCRNREANIKISVKPESHH